MNMKFEESSSVELKSEYIEDVKKEVVAFANSQGGTIYIGVTDYGGVCGVDNYDEISNRISSMVRDAIKPDLTRFVQYERLLIDGKTVVKVQVQEGSNKPYYIAKHGLKPSGVYVRQGNESAQASEDAIRQMIKISDGDSFEGRRSILQKLTFDELRQEFKNRGITLDTLKEKTLGIVDNNGLYTNLGLLLSDECPYTIKCAVFGGTDKVKFIDRKEFGGSIFRQMADCYEYLDLNNPTSATFEGLYRNDHRDFPENAVREALLNSLVHRDYSYSASILISIYSDRMEFVSVGGLLPGIQIQDVLLGLSICRNKKLADIFYRMKLIEAYGTGIQKIFSAYAGQARQPDIETGPNSFKLVLPRCGEEINENESLLPAEQQIMELLTNKNFIRRSEVNEALGVSQATASRLLKQMIAKGRIEKYGRGKNTKYGKKKSENES